ncbi:hypothetical protein THF5H11_30045 [Vibrio jasicida]|nr:hypothetical protein THF5H11_30045 [Vibrio jasicida]
MPEREVEHQCRKTGLKRECADYGAPVDVATTIRKCVSTRQQGQYAGQAEDDLHYVTLLMYLLMSELRIRRTRAEATLRRVQNVVFTRSRIQSP